MCFIQSIKICQINNLLKNDRFILIQQIIYRTIKEKLTLQMKEDDTFGKKNDSFLQFFYLSTYLK